MLFFPPKKGENFAKLSVSFSCFLPPFATFLEGGGESLRATSFDKFFHPPLFPIKALRHPR